MAGLGKTGREVGAMEQNIVAKLQLGQVEEDIKKEIGKRLLKGARLIAKRAKALAPYDEDSRHAEGRTAFPDVHHRDAIKAFGNRRGLGSKVKTLSNRGHLTEGPTRHWRSGAFMGQPHIEPAVDEILPQVFADMADII